jgi:ATP-dependent DNA ligase
MTVTRNLSRRLWCAELCLPRLALRPPAGPGWIHEIKHDGFRILAKQNPDGVRLFTRKGYDLGVRFTLVATAVAALPARSCLIDGEAIACDQTEWPRGLRDDPLAPPRRGCRASRLRSA